MLATKEQPEVPTVDFHYEKSPHYRTVRADGVTGGSSPHNEIQMSFYGDYAPIPEFESNEVIDGNRLGKVVNQFQKKGIVREVECTVTMAVEVAELFVRWLQERIRIAKGETESAGEGGHS